MNLMVFLENYPVNEIKRQGDLVGQSWTRYRAWAFEQFIVIVNEERNSPVAVFDLGQGYRPLYIYDWQDAGRLMLAGAGAV